MIPQIRHTLTMPNIHAIQYMSWTSAFSRTMHKLARLESIMLQNLFINLYGISPIFCLLCLFLCFLGMHYICLLYVHTKFSLIFEL